MADVDRHAARAAALERAQQAESRKAAAMIADFVAQMRERGVEPQPLRARPYSGGSTYKTNVRGWHLRRDGSVAAGEDGSYYVLVVPPSVTARWKGVEMRPSDPPLILGKGARDGQSIDLADAIAARLAEADSAD